MKKLLSLLLLLASVAHADYPIIPSGPYALLYRPFSLVNAQVSGVPGLPDLIQTGDYATLGLVIRGNIFQPTAEPPNAAPGLYVWGQADTGLPSTGNHVATWSDQSGLGNDYVQGTDANRPTYVANQVNGYGVVRFPGGSHWLGAAASYPPEATSITVWRSTANANQDIFSTSLGVSSDNSSSPDVIFQDLNLTLQIYAHGRTAAGTFTENAFHILTVTTSVAAGKYNVWIDGVHTAVDQTYTANSEHAALILGCGFDGCLTGDIPEQAIYNQVLGSSDRGMVESGFATKFGISIANSISQQADLLQFQDPFHVKLFGVGPAQITASSALVTDSNQDLASSTTTAAELSNVHGTTSAIQTQLNAITASKAQAFLPYSTGSLTSLSAHEIISSGKTVRAMTIENIAAAAAAFTCSGNPVLVLLDCGTSAGACTSGTTTLGSVTLSAANTITDGTISTPAIAAGHYWAWEVSSGTCTVLDAMGSAEAAMVLQ